MFNHKEYYQKNKEKIKEDVKRYRNKNKIKIKEYSKNYREKNVEKTKEYNKGKTVKEYMWKKAGIKDMTIERYNEMFEEQNGNCAICGRHEDEFKKILSVDHNHRTGEVRGLLCNKCNTAIGYLKDDINLLCSAISYLKCYNGL